MRLFVALVFTTVTVALTLPAHADDAAGPDFALMDHTGDGSHARFELAAVAVRDQADDPFLRTSVFGQYLHPSGFGGYAGLAMAAMPFVDDNHGDRVSVGNLELGTVFRRAVSSEMDVGVCGGLILPTANRDLISDADLIGVVTTLLSRPADLATTTSDITWLRLGVSPTIHSGLAALRLDIGVDIPISDSRSTDPLWHVNLGVGIKHQRFSATAELQNVSIDRESFHNAALSLRYLGKLSPYLAVLTPLDDWARGEVATIITGLTAAL
jgi:hypothetical protein